MATKFGDEKCGHSNSLEKEEEEEETLSLSDLPLNKDDENHLEKEEAQQLREAQEDFNFNSSGGTVLAESKMCAADEVFFQGQILPFRQYSISSEAGLAMFRTDIHPFISRSQSMDHRYSGGGFTSRSSSTRSSSIRSDHNSLSSGSSSSSSGTNRRTPLIKRKPPRARTHNQFHSHPSPTPQIRISTGHRRGQKSTIWSYFQVGLVRTPDIKLPDLKIRSSNISNTGKNFGSRNSNSSTTSTSADHVRNMDKNKQGRFFDRKGTLFGGCRCSVDAVDQTVNPRIVRIKNSSVNYETIGKEETNKKQKGKQAMMSRHHRTFEWLKQLSVEGGPEDEC